ncbi:hypothetical protein LOK49_LG09G01948 [Camellia lanceoleosa]|uniref:Uncharacterized protein n=1 Tax=Camellia lanceoleosa TaxID=1840588 RepID=A0ACC0GNB1_9ERIC|nr:hypothetical protein LOK49_LG09G01948 [Camellia lanceoleosa]
MFYGDKGLQFFDKGIAVILERWNDEKHGKSNVVVSYGGWVAICDLPFKLWNTRIFEQIGAKCGGLLAVDRRTKTFENLFEARLKVKGSNSGFLPSTVEVSTDEGAVTVRVKTLTKAVKCRGGHRQWSFWQRLSSELRSGGKEGDKVEGTDGTRGCLIPKEFGVHDENRIFEARSVNDEGRQRDDIVCIDNGRYRSGEGFLKGDGLVGDSGPWPVLGLSHESNKKQMGDEEGIYLGSNCNHSLGQVSNHVEDGSLGRNGCSHNLRCDGLNPVQSGNSVPGSNQGFCRVRQSMRIFDGENDRIHTANQREDELNGSDSRNLQGVEFATCNISMEHGIDQRGMSQQDGLNLNEIHLGLADVVDRSTGQFLQVGRPAGIDGVDEVDNDDALEIFPGVDRMINDVDMGICDPHGVLQALEGYGSQESSDESLGPNEEVDACTEKERADVFYPNLNSLFHEEEVPFSSCNQHTMGTEGEVVLDSGEKVCDSFDRDDMISSPPIQGVHSVSVRGGVVGESSVGIMVSNQNDNWPLLNTTRNSTSGSLIPQANNMDTHTNDLLIEESPNHRL